MRRGIPIAPRAEAALPSTDVSDIQNHYWNTSMLLMQLVHQAALRYVVFHLMFLSGKKTRCGCRS